MQIAADMKGIIIYYSYSGNTKKVAETLAESLKVKGEVEIISLEPTDESGNFFSQAKRAFWKKRATIKQTTYDLSGFDYICIGTPVWAFAPAPAINTYLDNCFGLEGKKTILFTTYGSGTGNERCINYMKEILAKKGVKEFNKFSVGQIKVKDKEFILAKIKEVLT